MHLANTWNDINSMYNEKFTLSSAIWTKYIFKSESLGTGQDQTECGVHCELSVDKCDFFLISGGKCHLGRYDYYGSGTVSSNDVPTTYHKSSISTFSISTSALMILGLLVRLGLCSIGPFSAWPHCSWPQTHVAPCYQPQTVVAPY